MSSIRQNHFWPYPDHGSNKAITPTFEPYPTPSPSTVHEEVRNGANTLAHEPGPNNFDVTPSPPYENWWPVDSSAFSVPFHTNDAKMAAVGGQEQNNLFLCDNPVNYPAENPISFSTPMEYLNNYANASTGTTMPYSLWERPMADNTGSTVLGPDEGFVDNLASPFRPLEVVQNKMPENQCPSNDERSEYGSDQSSGQEHISNVRVNTLSQRKSKSKRSAGQYNGGAEENLHGENVAFPHENEVQDQVQYTKPDPFERDKRVQRRNRVASNKFRVKKKQDIKNLQAEEEQLREEHGKLKSEASALRSRVTELKSNLLSHSQCDCSMIQNYINSQASSFVHNRVKKSTKEQ